MTTVHSRAAEGRARSSTVALAALCVATGCADLDGGEHYFFQVSAVASSQPRCDRELEIMFVPPRAQVVDALSNTVRIE